MSKAVVIALLFLVSFSAATSGLAAANSKDFGHGPSRLSCRSLKKCPRPLAARNDRVDPTDGFRHYYGGFNVRDHAYIMSTLYAAGYILVPLATIWLLLVVFGMVFLIIPGCRLALRRDIAYRQSLFWTLATLLLLLSVISLASMLSFAVASHHILATAHDDVTRLVTLSTSQANEDIRAVAKDLNATAYFLTKLDPKVSNTTATISNSTRELVAMVFGAEMKLVGNRSWNDMHSRLQQYRHLPFIRTDLILGLVFVLIACILAVMGLAMVLGRICNPRWTWTRSYLYIYVIPAGFVIVSALLTSAAYNFAFTKMVEDGVDALEEYGPPFNTTFDFEGFLPCAKLSMIGERAMREVQEAVAFIDSNRSAIHGYVSMQQHSNLTVYSAFNPQLDVMLVNASISLAASLPKIEKLRNCSQILRAVHTLARKHRPRLRTAGAVAWMSLVVAASTFYLLPALWGFTRALKRPDREIPALAPQILARPPSVNIPAQPNLVVARPPVYFGPEDCPRVRQVDVWTEFFKNKEMKRPFPEDN